MKNNVLLIFLLVSLVSCNSNYLDKMEEANGYDFDKVFKDSTNYLNFCEYLVAVPFFLHLQMVLSHKAVMIV